MKKLLRASVCVALIACLSMTQAVTSFAASKGIKKVNVKVQQSEAGFGIGSETEAEYVNVVINDSDAKQYTVSKYDFSEDETGLVSSESAPSMDITLTANDGYKFGVITAKNIRLTGDLKPTYVGCKRENSNKDLVIKVKLEGIFENAANVDYAEWDYNRPGVIKNYAMSDTNPYEVRLFNTDTGKSYSFNIPAGVKEFDMSPYLREVGDYQFKIREINAKSGKKGQWYECEEYLKMNEEAIAANNQKYAYVSLDGIGWQQDEKGWWFKFPSGDYAKSQWFSYNNHDFYFNAEGYMVTGWQQIDGSWYYMNERGEKLFSTVTPDGYTLDADGKLVE